MRQGPGRTTSTVEPEDHHYKDVRSLDLRLYMADPSTDLLDFLVYLVWVVLGLGGPSLSRDLSWGRDGTEVVGCVDGRGRPVRGYGR